MRVICYRVGTEWNVYNFATPYLGPIAKVERIALKDARIYRADGTVGFAGDALAVWGATLIGEPGQETLDTLGVGNNWPVIELSLRPSVIPLNKPLNKIAGGLVEKLACAAMAELTEKEVVLWDAQFTDIEDAEFV